ncbi:hypothetical protein [uncultured Pseudacidovorax sp.]|uniref:hypothetical protein n=1 Tax=uncultured Pseudacidovorax sp. TaxID=679313 RepID=UPI0025CDB9F7|nr:hypothetical protein [uncultured Pseudacidovorax sp.]
MASARVGEGWLLVATQRSGAEGAGSGLLAAAQCGLAISARQAARQSHTQVRKRGRNAARADGDMASEHTLRGLRVAGCGLSVAGCRLPASGGASARGARDVRLGIAWNRRRAGLYPRTGTSASARAGIDVEDGGSVVVRRIPPVVHGD